MLRRVVALLLVPCVLLPQAAAYGHTHSGGQPTGHDLRPHVPTAPPSHDHGHHHPGGLHHGHHHHHDDHVAPHPGVGMDADRESVPASDHDSDAVYVSPDVAVLRPHAAHETVASDGGDRIAWDTAFDAAFGRPRRVTRAPAHPPPGAAPPYPLYVRHLALLI